MNRLDFASGKDKEKNPPTPIQQGQLWAAIDTKDFGAGPCNWSIRIIMAHPIRSKTWICVMHNGGLTTIGFQNQFELTAEEIYKHFEFTAMFQPILPSPNSPINPFRQMDWPVNDGVWITTQDGTGYTATNGFSASHTHGIAVSGSFAPVGYASSFGVAQNISMGLDVAKSEPSHTLGGYAAR